MRDYEVEIPIEALSAILCARAKSRQDAIEQALEDLTSDDFDWRPVREGISVTCVDDGNEPDENEWGPGEDEFESAGELNCPLKAGCECEGLPRCPVCGYTAHDAAFQTDHFDCPGRIPDGEGEV